MAPKKKIGNKKTDASSGVEPVPEQSAFVENGKRESNKEKDQDEDEKSSWTFWFVLLGIAAAILGMYYAPTQDIIDTLDDISNGTVSEFLDDARLKLLELKPEEDATIGKKLYKKGYRAKHPLVIVPGFTSTGLELWKATPECSNMPFRSRMWGKLAMTTNVLTKLDCWMKHLGLHHINGRDPDGIRVRPVEGYEGAADFLEVYWVWGHIIANLNEVGYDSSNMAMMSYDWRMSPDNMEKRDGYLTLMKARIEQLVEKYGEKAIIMSHSFGSNVFHYFLMWVESDKGGKGGKGWAEKHIAAWNNIAGALLGIPKAAAALLSGEMKDTSHLGRVNALLERTQAFSRANRVDLFRTWGSLWAMLPKGENHLMGDAEGAPEDIYLKSNKDTKGQSFGFMLQFPKAKNFDAPVKNVTAREYPQLISKIAEHGQQWLDRYSLGYAKYPTQLGYDDAMYWSNPLDCALPQAPTMKIYCLYGSGKPTERAYAYRLETQEDTTDEVTEQSQQKVPYAIDVDRTGDGWSYGVLMTDGDGTVTVTSMGYMCVKGWDEHHNPANVSIITREYKHDPHPYYPRGGDSSGDHLDILGNSELLKDLIRTACGGYVQPRTFSKVREYAEEIYNRRYQADTPTKWF